MENALEIITALKAELWFKILASTVVAALCGLSTLMANRYIGVYNDAVRPLVGETSKGNLNYKALALSSFGLSIGFIIGFIPTSAAAGMLIIHIILLMSDIIGLALPQKKWTIFAALFLGIGWGYGMYWGLEGVQWLFENVTYPGFGFELGKIGDVYNALFAIFPALIIGYQFGYLHGLWTGSVITLTFILVTIFGTAIKLGALPISLLIGIILLIAIAFITSYQQRKKVPKIDQENIVSQTLSNHDSQLAMLKTNARAIQKNKWWFLATGMLIPLAASGFTLQMPQTVSMWATGDMPSVIITASIRAFSFIPLVVLTALVTGVYSPAGMTVAQVCGIGGAMIGILIVNATGNIALYLVGMAIGSVFGGLVQFGETYALVSIAQFLDKNPILRTMGNSMRTSLTQILNISFLLGGVLAAYVMGTTVSTLTGIAGLAPIGMLLVAGIYVLNKTFKKPIPEVAVGPAMAIVFGIIVNIIYFIA